MITSAASYCIPTLVFKTENPPVPATEKVLPENQKRHPVAKEAPPVKHSYQINQIHDPGGFAYLRTILSGDGPVLSALSKLTDERLSRA